MAFTVKELLDYCLDQSQLDKNLTEHYQLAQKIYNLVLDGQTNNFPFPFYSKISENIAFTSSQSSYDLPDDYLKSDNCYRVLMSNGSRGSPILIVSPWEFDRLSSGTNDAEPSVAWIDQNQSKITFNSNMSNPGDKGFVIRYFRKPTFITVGSNVDDDLTPDFPDQKTLCELIIVELMKYMNDDRYQMQMQVADKEMRDTKMGSYDYDDNSQMSLGKSFRAGRRPTRGGGYGNSF